MSSPNVVEINTAANPAFVDLTGVGGVTDVTGTAPIVSSGGNTPAISITPASAANAGSMSPADFTTLQNLSAAAAPLRKLSLTPQAQVTQFIRIDGNVLDIYGNIVAAAVEVTVETFAQQDTTGAITVNSGTQIMNTGAPAGKLSTAVIQTMPTGFFAFTITGSVGGNEDVLVRVTVDNGIVGQVKLHFLAS